VSNDRTDHRVRQRAESRGGATGSKGGGGRFLESIPAPFLRYTTYTQSRVFCTRPAFWRAMNEVTRILSDLAPGRCPTPPGSCSRLVYEEVAENWRPVRMAEETPGNTLNATAPRPRGVSAARRSGRRRPLGQPRPLLRCRRRGHASRARRECPAQEANAKHGGDRRRVELEVAESLIQAPAEDLLALD